MPDIHLARPYPEPGFRFQLWESYRTLAGDWVRIVEVSERHPGYETVRGDDFPGTTLGWRYNRSTHNSDLGRCTGTAHDFSDPRNLIPWTPRLNFLLSYSSGVVSHIRAHSLKDAMKQAEHRCTACMQDATLLEPGSYKRVADIYWGGGVRNAFGDQVWVAIARPKN